MNFPFYIAKRYLFAKKSQAAVNILSIVAVIGVAVGTMALIIILSVFNGFERLILSLFNAFNADLEVRLVEGKSFSIDDFPADEIAAIDGVLYWGEVIEETALLTYRQQQHIVKLRGVDENYRHITGLDTMIREGSFELYQGDAHQLIIGAGVAYMLNANIHDYLNPLMVFVPRRGRVVGIHPAQAFHSASLYASGVFSVQSEFDMEYVIAPVSLLRELTGYEDRVTSIIISVDNQAAIRHVQRQVASIIGDEFMVRNRLQQEEFLYKVMRSEKWAIFFILSFILIIAAFNITGSLTMLVLEKRKDLGILRSMGCPIATLKKIFLYQGLVISIGGAMLGLILGGGISWLQANFGIISLQAEGTFIVDAYPVHLNVYDFILVFFTVSAIGALASLLPVQKIKSFLLTGQS